MNFGGNVNLGNGLGPNMNVSPGKKIETPGASGSMEIPKNEAQPVDLFGIGASRDAVNQAQSNVADWRQVVNSAIMNRAMVRKGYASMERIQKNEAYIALGIAALGQAFGARAQYATGGANSYLQGVQAISQQNYQDANIQNELNYQNEVNLRNAELSQAQIGLEGAQGDLAFAQKGYLQKEQTLMDMAENEQKANEARRLAFDKAAWDFEYGEALKQGDFERAKELENIRARNRLLQNQEEALNKVAALEATIKFFESRGHSPQEAERMALLSQNAFMSPYQQGQLEQKAREFDYQQSQDEIDRQSKATSKEFEKRLRDVEIDIGVKTQQLKDATKKTEGILAKAKKNPVYWLEYAQALEEQVAAEKSLKEAKDSYDRLIGEQNQGGNQVWSPGMPLPTVGPTLSGSIGK